MTGSMKSHNRVYPIGYNPVILGTPFLNVAEITLAFAVGWALSNYGLRYLGLSETGSLQVVLEGGALLYAAAGLVCLLSPRKASRFVFGDAYLPTPLSRLVGAFWVALSVCIMSATVRPEFGVFRLLNAGANFTWLAVTFLFDGTNRNPIPTAAACLAAFWLGFGWETLPWDVVPWQELSEKLLRQGTAVADFAMGVPAALGIGG